MNINKKYIIIFGTLILSLIVIAGAVTYYQEREDQGMEEKDQRMVFVDGRIDVLSWDGWERSDLELEVKYDEDDGILKITNKFDADSYAQSNNKFFLPAKKPFEIRLKMETKGISDTENTQLGFVRLYNADSFKRPQSWLSVGLGTYDPLVSSNHLYLELIHRDKDKAKNSFQYIIQKDEKIVIPQGIVLGIKVEDDNSAGEKIIIYSSDTGEIFYQTNLPYEFFKKEILFFGLESWNITKDPQGVQMDIVNLSVLFP
jgi:hypothetical protein